MGSTPGVDIFHKTCHIYFYTVIKVRCINTSKVLNAILIIPIFLWINVAEKKDKHKF